jgi:hypothetical protein
MRIEFIRAELVLFFHAYPALGLLWSQPTAIDDGSFVGTK